MNLSDLFAVAGSRDPGQPALRFEPPEGTARVWTYEELLTAAAELAAGLAARGLAPGDRVVVFLGNRPELVLLHLALLRLGAVLVPMNLAYRRWEIAHLLTDAEPRLLVTERELLPVLDEVPPDERGGLERVVMAEELAEWRQESGSPSRPVTGDDLAMLLYTSGTTGRSKGAMLSHDNLLATITGLLAAWAWEAADVLLLTLPLFHTHGLVVGLDCALAAGATVILHPRFDAARVMERLASGGPTLFFGVPTMYVRLVDRLAAAEPHPDLAAMRLFCSGSAPLAPETFAAFERLTGHAILERYGMTETGMNLSNPYVGERRPGTVGMPLPGVSTRIVDRDGQAVPPGEAGTLLVRGSNVCDGYWRAPEKTAGSFVTDEEGRRWFRTGDLARIDPEDGYFTLLGRESELVLCGGFNVYPREVEEVLLGADGVIEAAVTGAPDPEWGEVPVAFLVAQGPVDPEALTTHCRAQIAAFKVPRRFHRVTELPRNALGKVQKHLLREPVEAS